MTAAATANSATRHQATLAAPRPLSVMLQFLGFGIAAAVADLWTKALAVQHLAWDAYTFGDRLGFFLVINTGAAGGVSLGEHTWLINVLGTVATILLVAMVVMPLARVAPMAGITMGLIAGGAAGNLLSLLSAARGVPDFIAWRFSESAIVFNLADVALWVGALLLVPIAVRVYRLAREERRVLDEQASRSREVRTLRLRALSGAEA